MFTANFVSIRTYKPPFFFQQSLYIFLMMATTSNTEIEAGYTANFINRDTRRRRTNISYEFRELVEFVEGQFQGLREAFRLVEGLTRDLLGLANLLLNDVRQLSRARSAIYNQQQLLGNNLAAPVNPWMEQDNRINLPSQTAITFDNTLAPYFSESQQQSDAVFPPHESV